MTPDEAPRRGVRALLRQARGWFSLHPEREDAVSVRAVPRDVQRWMADTDRALLDETPQQPERTAP